MTDNSDYLATNGDLIQVRKRLRDAEPVYIEATEAIRRPRPMSKKAGKSFSVRWKYVIATVNTVFGVTTKDLNLDDESLDLYRHIYQAISNKSRSFSSYRSDRAIQHAKKLGLHFMATSTDINVVLTQEQIEKLQVLVPRRKPGGSHDDIPTSVPRSVVSPSVRR